MLYIIAVPFNKRYYQFKIFRYRFTILDFGRKSVTDFTPDMLINPWNCTVSFYFSWGQVLLLDQKIRDRWSALFLDFIQSSVINNHGMECRILICGDLESQLLKVQREFIDSPWLCTYVYICKILSIIYLCIYLATLNLHNTYILYKYVYIYRVGRQNLTKLLVKIVVVWQL